jgi:hypothetical protein
MFFKKISWQFIFLLLLNTTHIQAQNSPFSLLGIGNLQTEAFAPHQMMGNLGASQYNLLYANNTNPAWLVKNRNVIIEVAAGGQVQNVSDNSQSQRDVSANLAYFSLVMPIAKKWTTNIGIKPFSTVNYDIEFTEGIPNTDFQANYAYRGRGGLNSFFWANGFQLYKNLLVGGKVSYVFGALTNEGETQLDFSLLENKIISFERRSVGGFVLSPSLAYSLPLKNKKLINFGLVYDFAGNLSGTQFSTVQRRNQNDGIISADTLAIDVPGSLQIPQRIRLGVSLDNPLHWNIGVDVQLQQWVNTSSFGQPTQLGNSWSVGLGGEYTPDYRAVGNLWSRATYRAGFLYQQLPIVIENESVNEFGINFGTSLPVGATQSTITYLHLGFGLGQRGSLSDNGLREQFFRFTLGASLSDFQWFRKVKIN